MSETTYCVLERSGDRYGVHLNLNVVDRLARSVMDGFKSIPRRGLEVGGLLLGACQNSSDHPVIVVNDFQPLESEHERGPSYVLSERDRELLSRKIAELGNHSARQVVGFYRSHTRSGFELDAEDKALIARSFSSGSHVFLLIKPTAGGLSEAAFMFCSEGRLEGSPEHVLTFDAKHLRSGDFPLTNVSEPEPEPAVQPSKSRAAGRLLQKVYQQLVEQPRDSAYWSRRMLWVPAAALAAIALSIFLWRGRPERISASQPEGTSASQPAVKRSPLALRIEKQTDGLRVSWDQQSPAVQKAQRGILSITDGDDRRQILLDPAQLATGSIAYWPAQSEVSFRLDVLADNVTISESVWSVDNTSGRSSASTPATDSETATRKSSRAASASRDDQSTPASSSEAPLPTDEASHSVGPEPAAATVPIIAPEPAEAPKEPLAAILEDQSQTTADESADKPASPFVTVKAEAVKGSLMGRVVGKIPLLRRARAKQDTPPTPIRQSVPTVPDALQRALRAEVPVDVKVYVTKEGKVGFAELLSEATGTVRDLANLAVYAARRWEFEPAREGDRKVPGEVILHFRFGNETVAKR